MENYVQPPVGGDNNQQKNGFGSIFWDEFKRYGLIFLLSFLPAVVQRLRQK